MARRKLSTFERLRRGERLNRKERREVQQRLNLDDPGLDMIHRDAAGIDVGNESHFVSVPPDRDPHPIREFGSWTAALEAMARWLKDCGIRTVVMQSTGVYWIALHDVLQRQGLEVKLVDARGTKNVPGRKSDVQECQWLRKLHTYGLLRPCFLPPPEIHAVRTLWRLHIQHVRDAGRCIQQMQKALIQMNVQLHNALSDISGVSGQAIIRALLKGERNARVLAKLRDRRCEASEEEIMQSLQGNWKEDVLFELQQAVDAYDFYQRQMKQCDQQLRRYMSALPSPRTRPSPIPAERQGRKTRPHPQVPQTRKPAGLRSRGRTGTYFGGEPHYHRRHRRPDHSDRLSRSRTRFERLENGAALDLLAESGSQTRRQWRPGRPPRSPALHQPRRQRLSHGRAIAGPQSNLFRSPLPIFTCQIGRTESGQSDGTLLGLSLLSTAHPRTDLGRSRH